MENKHLIYTTDKESLIRRAREKGFTNYQIVITLTRGSQYKERVLIAKEWHPYLGISYGAFMKMVRGIK